MRSDVSSPPRQVPTSRECVGFGAVQEVAVGLVQPASAALYDYYNPGERLGALGRFGAGVSTWASGSGAVLGGRDVLWLLGVGETVSGGVHSNCPLSSRAHMFCVLRGPH